MGDLWFGLRRVDEVEREVEEEKREARRQRDRYKKLER